MSSCNVCDGELVVVTRELAEVIGALRGPRWRRDGRRVNQYGGKGVIQYGAAGGGVAGLAPQAPQASICLVDWESADGMPRQITIEWGQIAKGGGGTYPAGTDVATGLPLSYRAQAQVIFSSPSVTEDYFYADVGRGQRCTFSASRVSVTMEARTPPPGYLGGALGVYAAIGYGTSPSLAPVVRTEYVDNLPAPVLHPSTGFVTISTTALLAVPRRANFLLPVRTSLSGALIGLSFFDSSGAPTTSLQYASGNMITPAPIGDDEDQIQFTSFLVANGILQSRLVFQLSV